MSVTSKIALGKQKLLFAIEETTFGVLELPSASGLVRMLQGGNVSIQEKEMHADEQVRDSRDEFSEIDGKYAPGTFTVPVYVKPSGSAGTAPDGASLFKAILGATPSIIPSGLLCKTGSTASILKVTTGVLSDANIGDLLFIENQITRITGHTTGADDLIDVSPALSSVPAVDAPIGQSVNYKLATYLPSLSLYFKDGHTVFAQAGCLVEEMKVDIAGKDIAKVEFSGSYARQIKTGTDAVGAGGIDNSAITFPVAELAAFDVDSRFDCETETNILVSAKSSSTGAGTLTVVRGTAPSAHAAAVATTPWLPTGVESGNEIHGKKGNLKLGSTGVTFSSLNVSVKNGNSMLDGEAGTEFASDYIEGDREVGGSVKIYFRQDSLKHFSDAKTLVQSELIAQAGDTAGSIMAVSMPSTQVKTPALSGDKERELDIPFKGFASGSGNNSITLSFL